MPNNSRNHTMTLRLAVLFAGLLAHSKFTAAQSAAWGQCMVFPLRFLLTSSAYFGTRWRRELDRCNGKRHANQRIICSSFEYRPALLVGLAHIAILGTRSVSKAARALRQLRPHRHRRAQPRRLWLCQRERLTQVSRLSLKPLAKSTLGAQLITQSSRTPLM